MTFPRKKQKCIKKSLKGKETYNPGDHGGKRPPAASGNGLAKGEKSLLVPALNPKGIGGPEQKRARPTQKIGAPRPGTKEEGGLLYRRARNGKRGWTFGPFEKKRASAMGKTSSTPKI